MHALRISIVFVAALAACSHAKPEPTATEQQPVATPAPAPVAEAPPAQPVKPEPVTPPPPTNIVQSIYFDFDKSSLTTASRDVLSRIAGAAATSGATVRIEGNCDERGSDEHNIALGQRRAEA